MEQILFSKAGIIELHATMHERLDVLLRHGVTVPDELRQKTISGFGHPSAWKQLVHNVIIHAFHHKGQVVAMLV